jgi:hypothetical protein
MLIGLIGLSQATSPATIQQMILTAAAQYGVPANIALGIAAHESGFNPNATNVNSNGTTDYGVMQLNTSVLQTYGLTPAQAFDPQTNINTAMALLGGYISTYGNVNTALQAYASGPGTVASGAAPNSTAYQFINYVTSYQPPASLDLSSVDTSTVATAGLVPSTDAITTAFTDLGNAISSGDFSQVSGTDWGVVLGGVALVLFGGWAIAR